MKYENLPGKLELITIEGQYMLPAFKPYNADFHVYLEEDDVLHIKPCSQDPVSINKTITIHKSHFVTTNTDMACDLTPKVCGKPLYWKDQSLKIQEFFKLFNSHAECLHTPADEINFIHVDNQTVELLQVRPEYAEKMAKSRAKNPIV